MFPLPIKVKNVNLYPYINWPGGGVGPAILPVIEGASGVYSVGSLFTNVLYSLSLHNGKQSGHLAVHDTYMAIGETEAGIPFTSHWMYCLKAGEEPSFGLTINAFYVPYNYQLGAVSAPPYFTIAPLTDITVSQLFAPPAVGQYPLITKGVGNIIATKTGTPNQIGVEVVSGERSGVFYAGTQNIIISGKNAEGELVTLGSLTCSNAGHPAVFLQQLA